MAFTAKDVAALRERTNVGMMDCKKALQEADGDMDKAVEILREKGLASAAKKAGRIAAEGTIGVYTDAAASALVELNCETDFVGNNPDFKALANQIAKTVVAVKPADVEALAAATIADGSASVADSIQELFLKIRENLQLRRFALVEGTAVSYIHGGGSVGVLVSFDTDAADKPEFAEMGKNIAMQVAAMNPEYLRKEDISAEELEKMKTITIESALNKPDSLPKPILQSIIEKTIGANKWSDEDVAAYEEQKKSQYLFNFLSKEAVAALAETAVAGKDEYTGRLPRMKKRLLERDGIVPKLYDFRLLDDDGEVYAYGKSTDNSSEAAFAPLDRYMYEYGCTEIQYKNPATGEYETL